jgi:hypothetical protein
VSFEGAQDGTWEVFGTRINAERYALAAWLLALRRRAAQGDGTLLNVITRVRERLVDEWPDSLAELRSMMLAMNPSELTALRTRLDRLPWLGTRGGVLTETDGRTLAWFIPQQTLSGQWAVRSFLGGGVPEPAWPPLPVGA